MMPVRLVREPSNHVDSNAITVHTSSGRILGHVEKRIAAVIGPIMDRMPVSLSIKRYLTS